MLQIAVNTPIVPGPDDLDFCLPVIAEAGFDGIDASLIRVWSKKAPEACPTEEVFLEKALTIAEKIRKNGLSVLQTHGPILMKTADDLKDPRQREVLQWAVHATRAMGTDRMILHPVTILPERKDNWAKTIEICEELIPFALRYHVTICLENLFRDIRSGDLVKSVAATGSDYETAAKVIDDLNRKAGAEVFGFCLDTGHALLASLDVKDMVVTMGSRLKALHIHDNNGLTDQHLMPYIGLTKWERFLDGLAEIDYRGTLSFETHDAWAIFDPELYPIVEKLIAETGRMFARRIEERR